MYKQNAALAFQIKCDNYVSEMERCCRKISRSFEVSLSYKKITVLLVNNIKYKILILFFSVKDSLRSTSQR